MEMIVITGMSGAGKSSVVDAMEDMGYYCVDNLPVQLIGKFVELASQSSDHITKMALVVDARGGETFQSLISVLDQLPQGSFRLLFLDCVDDKLVTRFKETRRKHPLSTPANPSIAQALLRERAMLEEAKARADFIVDTTHLSRIQLREQINRMFLGKVSQGMLINVMSFGFKHGYPSEADLVFDVRCLPNPFYIKELKRQTGLDPAVSAYVMQFEQAQELLKKLKDLMQFLIPLYIKEGKTQLVVAFGCTGGKHRSVTFAERIFADLLANGSYVTVNHRDITK